MSIALASQTAEVSTPPPRRGITWLSSYPKSGNTWFRIFLQNLLSGREELVSLDGIGFPIASARKVFDDFAGIDSSDMSHEEIELLRPRVYEQIVDEATEFPIFFKCHDAFTYLPSGEAMLSRQASAGAIYFVRNPLDVAVSFAYHNGHEDFDKSIAEMACPQDAFCQGNGKLPNQLRQKLCGWSGHMESWLRSGVPLHVMRYEDMVARPLEMFSSAVRFAGLDYDEIQIERALANSRFDKLREMEQEHGFREKCERCNSFFRKGQIGSWRDVLSNDQVQRIIADHGAMMERFQYLVDASVFHNVVPNTRIVTD